MVGSDENHPGVIRPSNVVGNLKFEQIYQFVFPLGSVLRRLIDYIYLEKENKGLKP